MRILPSSLPLNAHIGVSFRTQELNPNYSGLNITGLPEGAAPADEGLTFVRQSIRADLDCCSETGMARTPCD